MCSKVIYTGLIKTEIDNWNSDGYFHRACAICEKSWWKVPGKFGLASDKKMIRKFNSIIRRFFAPHSQINVFSLYMGQNQHTIPKLGATNS